MIQRQAPAPWLRAALFEFQYAALQMAAHLSIHYHQTSSIDNDLTVFAVTKGSCTTSAFTSCFRILM